jgi:hypothetical protein
MHELVDLYIRSSYVLMAQCLVKYRGKITNFTEPNFLEKLTVMKLFMSYPTFYGTGWFFTEFKRALHRSLS